MDFLKFDKTKVFYIGLTSIALLGSIGSALFYYNKYKISLKSQRAITEIEQIVRKVSSLMDLPQGETPTLATVSDKTQLQNQSFFQNAENGDRILVYSGAKKAILYRPSTNKIIDIAPITPLEEVAGDATGSSVINAEEIIKVALYNGSGIAGLASLAEDKLKADKTLGNRIQVTRKEYAQSQYQGVLVVDLKGNQNSVSQKIAQILSGKVGSLPIGEKIPETQILIILGKQ